MKAKVAQIQKLRAQILNSAGNRLHHGRHDPRALPVREQVDALLDKDSFLEYGLLASHKGEADTMHASPADGVITGHGTIAGRSAAVIAYDAAVFSGHMGHVGEDKAWRMRRLAMANRIPLVYMLEGGGIREETGDLMLGLLHFFPDLGALSGLVPIVAVINGPCVLWHSLVAARADFVVMREGAGRIHVLPSAMANAAAGQRDDHEGHAAKRAFESGFVDLLLPDDATCIQKVKEFLRLMPVCAGDPVPTNGAQDPGTPVEAIMHLVPDDPHQPFDMMEIIHGIIDGRSFVELTKGFAGNLITGLATIHGGTLGVIANQSLYLDGRLDGPACHKAGRFISMCDAFGLPILFLQDTPGLDIASATGGDELLKGLNRLSAVLADATVPIVTLIVRKGYGLSHQLLGSRLFHPDLLIAWPWAILDAHGTRAGGESIWHAGCKMHVDDIVAPEATRDLVRRTLLAAAGKTHPMPKKKHGVLGL